ncbi:MAG TPA: DUF2939 domain-containing protein [Caulobacteraceae bacterium]|jgi:hypothetical protein|nr:DUF2939 domain-containing protein [Caulobacteraceae bacterium]
MSKRNIWVSAAVVGVFAVILAVYALSPLFAANAVVAALKTGDRDRLEQLIDFPTVRAHLKEDLRARLSQKMESEAKDNAFASALGSLIGPTLIDRAVDNFMTPAMMSAAIRNGSQTSASSTSKSAGSDKASGPKTRLGYDGLNRFKITYLGDDGGPAIGLIMTRQGLFGWRVTRIDLSPELLDGLSSKRALTEASANADAAAAPSASAAPSLADDPAPDATPAVATPAPVAPPPPPERETPPPASDAYASNGMAGQSLAIARAYMSAWSSADDPSGGAIAPFYANDIMYYGRRTTSAAVMREKHAFAERWPSRTYVLREPTLTSNCSPEGGCTVTGVVDWRAENAEAGRRSTGAASFVMVVQNGRITAEGGAVLSRNFVKQ